jgi:predicted glycoside hydrolase/deacetylase ChbG (UPF0249 family)
VPFDRHLIVNADDFGFSPGVNRGIAESHERGIVSSASLMVRWPAAAEAAGYALAHPKLSVGLHLDLGEWALRDGAWVPLYEVTSLDDAAAVRAEAARQLDLFRRLIGRDPSHLDSHQHVHRGEPTRSVMGAMAAELGAPLRHVGTRVQYCGAFYGQTHRGEPYSQGIGIDALLGILAALAPGLTELACHPGAPDDVGDTPYRSERSLERETLCDPRARAEIERLGIRLCSFDDPVVRADPFGGARS